jgi:hypothetical protein
MHGGKKSFYYIYLIINKKITSHNHATNNYFNYLILSALLILTLPLRQIFFQG